MRPTKHTGKPSGMEGRRVNDKMKWTQEEIDHGWKTGTVTDSELVDWYWKHKPEVMEEEEE